ncbi:Zinc finger protein 653 [Frankliniella fusca]|uniref:Zinc finger protein 653 n=1 Tax=Frankliniella fusca TaxID=407009 RepID=A0AAE1HPB1_9NEOP|nr:Zinc finger protein 653 [Frankliniella fusca]
MESQKNLMKCTFCAFQCFDETSYNRHYVKKHRLEEDFSVKCALCATRDGNEVQYNNLTSFKSHLQRSHGSSKNYTEHLFVTGSSSRNSTSGTLSVPASEIAIGQSQLTASSSAFSWSSSTFPSSAASECATEHIQIATSGSGGSGNISSTVTCEAEEHVEEVQVNLPNRSDSEDDAGVSEECWSGSESESDSALGDNKTSAQQAENQDSPNLKWQSAKFLLSLREEALVSQSAVNKAVDGIDELFANYSESIKEHLMKGRDPESGTISEEHIRQTIAKFQENSLFSDVDSKKKLDSFSKQYCTFIEPQKVELYKEEKTDKSGKIRVKTYNAYVCQFLPGLKRLLTRRDILECVDNPLENTEGVYRTYQDGRNAKTHPILSDPKNLGIQLCYDDLEISSPLGPVKHKLSLYYWTLANIHPHLRSSLKAIGIAAIVNHSDIMKCESSGTAFTSLDDKYHMHCKVLAPFLNDIKLLEQGIKVDLNEEETREFKGTLQSVTGDTPAVAVLGGFKESVGPAHKPCHLCLADHHEMKAIFNEDCFEKRTEENRKIHLKSITDAKTMKERQTNSTATGYNGPSCIAGLDSFNQISCFLYDTMHIILEGVLPAHMRLLLDYCVNNKHVYSIKEINEEVKSLSSQLSPEDRPAPIKIEHLQSSLRQSASQMLRLATLLPIFMASKPEIEDRLSNFSLLLRITYGLLCYELTDAEIEKLKRMIQSHHEKFMVDYPDFDITPKFHYMIHLPSQIQEFGPTRYTWSMRYESMHSYIKNIMRIIKNFKNPPKSCSYRYESLRACQMFIAPGEKPQNYLVPKDSFTGVKVMKLKEYSFSYLVTPILGNPNLLIKSCGKLLTKGVEFSVGSVVLLKRDKPPSLGEIKGIVTYEEITLLIISKLQCEQFSCLSNSFCVLTPPNPDYTVTFTQNLAFFRPLLKLKYKQLELIVPKYHNLVLDYSE